MTPTTFLDPSPDAVRAFLSRGLSGEIIMLNLLRLRAVADYTGHPELAPASDISGEAAFERYYQHTLPFLLESGGSVMFLGHGGRFLIGPADERWDIAMLVVQKSAESFLSFASNPGYLAGLGHRTAAVEDTRLLPLQFGRPKYST